MQTLNILEGERRLKQDLTGRVLRVTAVLFNLDESEVSLETTMGSMDVDGAFLLTLIEAIKKEFGFPFDIFTVQEKDVYAAGVATRDALRVGDIARRVRNIIADGVDGRRPGHIDLTERVIKSVAEVFGREKETVPDSYSIGTLEADFEQLISLAGSICREFDFPPALMDRYLSDFLGENDNISDVTIAHIADTVADMVATSVVKVI